MSVLKRSIGNPKAISPRFRRNWLRTPPALFPIPAVNHASLPIAHMHRDIHVSRRVAMLVTGSVIFRDLTIRCAAQTMLSSAFRVRLWRVALPNRDSGPECRKSPKSVINTTRLTNLVRVIWYLAANPYGNPRGARVHGAAPEARLATYPGCNPVATFAENRSAFPNQVKPPDVETLQSDLDFDGIEIEAPDLGFVALPNRLSGTT